MFKASVYKAEMQGERILQIFALNLYFVLNYA